MCSGNCCEQDVPSAEIKQPDKQPAPTIHWLWCRDHNNHPITLIGWHYVERSIRYATATYNPTVITKMISLGHNIYRRVRQRDRFSRRRAHEIVMDRLNNENATLLIGCTDAPPFVRILNTIMANHLNPRVTSAARHTLMRMAEKVKWQGPT